jgi:hypothetical protein
MIHPRASARDQRNPSNATQVRQREKLRQRNFSSHVFDAYDKNIGPLAPQAPRETAERRNVSSVFDAVDPLKNPLNKGNVPSDWQTLQTAPYDNSVYNPPVQVDKNEGRPEVKEYTKRTQDSHCFDEYVPRTHGKKIDYGDTPFSTENGIFEEYNENKHHVTHRPHKRMMPDNQVYASKRNPTLVDELPMDKPIRAKRLDNHISSVPGGELLSYKVQQTVHSRPVAGINDYEAEHGPGWRMQLKQEEDAARIRQLPVIKPAYKRFEPVTVGRFTPSVQANVNRARFLSHMKDYYSNQNFTALDVKRKNEADSLFRPPSPEPVAFQSGGDKNPQYRPMSQFKSLDGFREPEYVTPQQRRKMEDKAKAQALQNNRVMPVDVIRNKMKTSVFSDW